MNPNFNINANYSYWNKTLFLFNLCISNACFFSAPAITTILFALSVAEKGLKYPNNKFLGVENFS